MGLQVRLRQTQDDRVIDLEARTLKQPIVVGRSPQADLQVFAASVAARHCILFVHEGRWVVQALSSGGTTIINKLPLKGAVALRTGDQIVIGDAPDRAAIEIDPAGTRAGRTGEPVLESKPDAPSNSPARRISAKAPVRSDAEAIPLAPRPPGPPPARVPGPPPRRPQEILLAPPTQVTHTAPDDLDMLQYAASSTPRKRPRRKQGSGGGAIVVCVIAVGAIAWGVYYIVHRHPIPPDAPAPVAALNKPAPRVPEPPAVEEEENVRYHKNLFTQDSTRKDLTVPATDPAAPPPEIVAASNAKGFQRDPTSNASAGELTWNDVLDSADLSDQGMTILRIDDYARTHPGLHTKELTELRLNAIDALWWKRVAQLFAREKRLKTDIAGKEKDLNEETNTGFRKQLLSEKADLKTSLDQVKQTLKDDMGYATETAPKTETKEGLAAARAARDSALYATWSASLKSYIREHNGQTPWIGED